MLTMKKPRNLSGKKLLMSKKFHARTIDEADGRRATVKSVRKLLEELIRDSGADSAQKVLLCKRAAFIALRLESMEADAAEGKNIDFGSYGHLTNNLLGLISRLGAEKSLIRKVTALEDYIGNRHSGKKKRK